MDIEWRDSMVETNSEKCESNVPGSLWAGIYWWTFLVVAVLAVPSIGFVIAMAVPGNAMSRVIVFVLTCWISTYLGMHLMKKPPLPKQSGSSADAQW